MRRRAWVSVMLTGILWAGAGAAAQAPSPNPASIPTNSSTVPSQSDATVTGGKLHGVVKSGNIPLPGVTVTAQNTLTGKRFTTTTDITGAWSMTIPQNGRYVIRTQFAAFASGSQEALLNASSHDQTVNFELMLASRAAEQEKQQEGQSAQVQQAIRQLAGNGAQSLSLMSALTGDTESGGASGGSGSDGASLPSIAGNSDFSDDSVSITGQSGSVSPLAGVDMDRMRDFVESMRAQNGGQGPGGAPGAGPGGGNFAGGGGLFGGGFGGDGCGFGGRRRLRRRPRWRRRARQFPRLQSQPAARRLLLDGQQLGPQRRAVQPARSAAAAAGVGHQSLRRHAHGRAVYSRPHQAQRQGHGVSHRFPACAAPARSTNTPPCRPTPSAPATFPGSPTPSRPFRRPRRCSSTSPSRTCPATTQNYHLLTTAQSNTTQAGVRYMRSLGANASPFGVWRTWWRRRRPPVAADHAGPAPEHQLQLQLGPHRHRQREHLPELGGKTASDSDSVQAGYTLGYHKLTSIFNASWNRSDSQATNFFTNGDRHRHADRHPRAGRQSAQCELAQLRPAQRDAQQLYRSQSAAAQVLHFADHLRSRKRWPGSTASTTSAFGGDYRRVHRDFLGGSNSTGSFYFTGVYTGSSLGDFLLGLPQETSIDSRRFQELSARQRLRRSTRRTTGACDRI